MERFQTNEEKGSVYYFSFFEKMSAYIILDEHIQVGYGYKLISPDGIVFLI